ncbi:MAG: Bug family tripartite tricarboxylate transporter substrate binding protein [Lautropia sp.]
MSRLFFSLILLLATFASASNAQDSADGPVRLIVPFAAGGSADLIARLVAPPIGEKLGRNLIVENRAGAGGTIGAAGAARAEPDGRTLFFAATGPSAVSPSIYSKLPYDPIKSFVPISMVTVQPSVVVVAPELGVSDLKQLIALAKASPGKLNFGSPGIGTTSHLGGELFKSLAGVELTHVPYKDGPMALQDLLAGRIQIIFDNVGPLVGLIKAGRLKALAVISDERSTLLPDLATAAEAGLPGFAYTIWFGISAPAGTPPAIRDRVNAAIRAALAEPAVRGALAERHAEARSMSPAEFDRFIASDISRWAAAVKSAGIASQ